MSNNIDQLFKKAMLEQQCEPPDSVWQNIERELDRRSRKRGLWWFRSIAAIALLLITFSIWKLHYSKEFNVPAVAGFPSIHSVGYSPLQADVSSLLQLVFNEESIGLTPAQTFPATGYNSREKMNLKIMPVQLNIHPWLTSADCPEDSGLKNNFIRQDFIPLTSKEALKNQHEYLALIHSGNAPEKEKDKMKVALSGHFTPAYSSGNYSSSVKNTRGYDYNDSQMDGIMNVGGGLAVTFKTGKRLSLQTGLFYSRMGQKTTESNTYLRTAAFARTDDSRRVTTPLGNIKTRHRAVAYRSPEATIVNSIAAASYEETLEQIFGSLSVPLYLRCKLNDNRISFSLVGGFSGNFIVNNKVFLKNGNDKELLGSTENIRNFNMSTDWGLGVEYPVTSKIKIMIEPGFKYFLQSLSQDHDIDYKPYQFTLSTGIGFEF